MTYFLASVHKYRNSCKFIIRVLHSKRNYMTSVSEFDQKKRLGDFNKIATKIKLFRLLYGLNFKYFI